MKPVADFANTCFMLFVFAGFIIGMFLFGLFLGDAPGEIVYLLCGSLTLIMVVGTIASAWLLNREINGKDQE